MNNALAVLTAFNIDDLKLSKPKICNNTIQSKVSKIKGEVLIKNVRLVKKPLKKNELKFITCLGDLRFKDVFLKLQKKMEDLYNKYIEDSDVDDNIDKDIHYEQMIKFNSEGNVIGKFNLNKKLKLIEDLDYTKNYNLSIELYGISQDNNIIKIMWRLKSLELIDYVENNYDEEDIEILNYNIFKMRDVTLDKFRKELNHLEKKCQILRTIFDQMKNENNIDKFKILEENFLENN
jgi:hypothetical protein